MSCPLFSPLIFLWLLAIWSTMVSHKYRIRMRHRSADTAHTKHRANPPELVRISWSNSWGGARVVSPAYASPMGVELSIYSIEERLAIANKKNPSSIPSWLGLRASNTIRFCSNTPPKRGVLRDVTVGVYFLYQHPRSSNS